MTGPAKKTRHDGAARGETANVPRARSRGAGVEAEASRPLEAMSFAVEALDAARPLDGVLRAKTLRSWGAIRDLVRRGKVFVDGAPFTDPTAKLRLGAVVEVRPQARRTGVGVLDRAAIAYVDPHIVVVRKPAGISTIPFEGETDEGGTLDEHVRRWLVRNARHAPSSSLGIVHRLDKETSGLLVLARTFAAKRQLSQAFRVHAIERRYVALVHGVIARPHTIETYIVPDRGDGLRGAPRARQRGAAVGQLAITHVAPVAVSPERSEYARDGATAVVCALETGRTHQIRVHLAESWHPVIGDRVYTRDRLRAGLPLIEAPRLMLHAAVLGFDHPVTGAPLRFTEPLPGDLQRVAKRLLGAEIALDFDRLPL